MKQLFEDICAKVCGDFSKGMSKEKQDSIDLALMIVVLIALLFSLFGWYVFAMVPAIIAFGLALMDGHKPSKVINVSLALGLSYSVYTQSDSWVLYLSFAQILTNFGMRIGKIDKDETVILQGMLGAVGVASVLILYTASDYVFLLNAAYLMLFVSGIAGVYVALKMGNVIQGSVVSLIVGVANIMGLQAGFPLLVGILNAGLLLLAIGSVSRQVKFLKNI